MSDLIYLYGFVPESVRALPPGLEGVDGRNVELQPIDSFSAVTSSVNANEFGSAAIESRLQDLAWVAERGAEHERIVAWFVDHAQILPASLFTLYSSMDVLAQTARQQRDVIAAELERLHGLREWDVKISYDARLIAQNAARFSENVRELDAEIAAAPPGRRYLLEKKRTDFTKNEVARVAAEQATHIINQVRPFSTELITMPIPQTREQLPVVLYAALLIARDHEASLVKTLEASRKDLEGAGLNIEFSGPWAPYRFVRHGRD